MQLLVFLLACYGATNIITISRLFRGVRAWIGRRSETAAYGEGAVDWAIARFWDMQGFREN